MKTILIETKLTDGSSVFTLQVINDIGDVVEISCYDQKSADTLLIAMRQCALSMDIVVNN